MIVPDPRFQVGQPVRVNGQWTGAVVELQFRKSSNGTVWFYRVRQPHGPFAYVPEHLLSSEEAA